MTLASSSAMDVIRTILVPVDFDSSSGAALEHAVRLARALGAKIKLLHVVPFALSDVSDELFYAQPNASIRNRTNALKRLGDIAEKYRDIPITSEIREGIAWDEIVGAAQQEEADLIIVGTHGRHGVVRGLLGSVAERVVRASPVPVMTVRASIAPEERTEFASR
jgi:nucleotide-binding universal stress UspA family protein